MKINWVISTGFRNWAIHELSKTYSVGLKTHGFTSFFSEIPLSRRQIRTFKGWLYLPKADIGMLMHQDLGQSLFLKGKLKSFKKSVVRYTHHNKEFSNYIEMLRSVDLVIVENTYNFKHFIDEGIAAEKILLMPYPIDPKKFYRDDSKKPNRDVILVSNFYLRKRPDLVHRVVKANPDISFTLYGKNWENYSDYSNFASSPNLQILKFNWENYPNVLKSHKIFLSLSDLESGPVPLLEALSSGLQAVVTDIGTARDISPSNTHLIPVDPSIGQVSNKIRKALDSNFHLIDNFEQFTECYQIQILAKRLSELFIN